MKVMIVIGDETYMLLKDKKDTEFTEEELTVIEKIMNEARIEYTVSEEVE